MSIAGIIIGVIVVAVVVCVIRFFGNPENYR